MIYPFENIKPIIGENARIAENASIIGDVELGPNVNIWYGAVLRGDMNSIRISANTNIQDNAVVHVGSDNPVCVGENVTIGHSAIVHGCTIGSNCLIGMGSILLNGCVIGDGSLVGAGSLVTEGTVIPPGSVVMGSPAKVIRPMREADTAGNETMYREYLKYAERVLPGKPCDEQA